MLKDMVGHQDVQQLEILVGTKEILDPGAPERDESALFIVKTLVFACDRITEAL